MSKIKCNGVNYRQGYIEVDSQIHGEHINIEIWNVHPDLDISNEQSDVSQLNDSDVIGNTEIELSVEQAELLIKKLSIGINKIKGCS